MIINAANYGATVVVQTTAEDQNPKSEGEEKGGKQKTSYTKDKGGGGDKNKKGERDYSNNCNACGRTGHTAGENSCYYIWAKHPDFNKEWKHKHFDKSEKGKAWIAKVKISVAINSKLDGTKWEFGENPSQLSLRPPLKKKGKVKIPTHTAVICWKKLKSLQCLRHTHSAVA